MKTLRLILGDQLSRSVNALYGIDRARDVVLMVEVHDDTTYVRHHKQKIVLVLSAMRHFAESLRAEGIDVDYVRLDDKGNSGSFTGELGRALSRREVDRIVVTEPGEYRVWELMQAWGKASRTPIEIRQDDRFLCSRAEFADWAKERKSFRMEFFYRHMRRKTGWLMNGGQPEGGKWNYDAENRRALPRSINVPARRRFKPDAITRDVMALVGKRFADHFGDLDSFGWGVTRKDALDALRHFITSCLPLFGEYQDAMKTGGIFCSMRFCRRTSTSVCWCPERCAKPRSMRTGRTGPRCRPSRGSSGRYWAGESTYEASIGRRCRRMHRPIISKRTARSRSSIGQGRQA